MTRLNARWFNFNRRGQAWDRFWQDGAPVVDLTVVPDTAALTLTAFAPTIVQPVSVVPSTLALALTSFAPTATTSNHVTVIPAAAALTLAAFAPAVTVSTIGASGAMTGPRPHPVGAARVVGRARFGVVRSLAKTRVTAFAPSVTVSNNKIVTPATPALTLTMFAPSVAWNDDEDAIYLLLEAA